MFPLCPQSLCGPVFSSPLLSLWLLPVLLQSCRDGSMVPRILGEAEAGESDLTQGIMC